MLQKALVEDLIHAALSTGGDFAEVFVEDRFNSNLSYVGGNMKSIISGKDFGIGIRILKGLQSVYAYTNEFEREPLLGVALEAAQAITGEPSTLTLDLTKEAYQSKHPILQYPQDTAKKDKVDKLRQTYDHAKQYDERISQVSVRYIDDDQQVLIANSDGKLIEDRRVHTRLSIQAVASEGTDMQTGSYAPGAAKGFEFF